MKLFVFFANMAFPIHYVAISICQMLSLSWGAPFFAQESYQHPMMSPCAPNFSTPSYDTYPRFGQLRFHLSLARNSSTPHDVALCTELQNSRYADGSGSSCHSWIAFITKLMFSMVASIQHFFVLLSTRIEWRPAPGGGMTVSIFSFF